jgi:serine phosphatase RsbU (regulator of sigma subunit)
MNSQDDALVFADESDEILFLDDEVITDTADTEKWKILITDDESEVHAVTRLVLNKFSFDNKGLAIYSTYSAAETKAFLSNNPDIALILLDVVMESDDAGLQVVEYIRKVLKNTNIRIVLRTGQPGVAPEELVVQNYDIDGYRSKTEMTVQALNTTLISSLRAYKEIRRIEEIVIERTKELAEINQNLTDSIAYASRIQMALLPSREELRQYFPNSFVIYMPKAIVSGDLYWYWLDNPYFYIGAIDCTGHGVPGAMMSVLANSQLDDIIKEKQIKETSKILSTLHTQVSANLKRGQSEGTPVLDGMDVALCRIDTSKKEILFSGAQRPLLFLNNKQLIEIEGDKMPIGHSRVRDDFSRNYTQKSYTFQTGDRIYLFSDGATDQFGGTGERKRKISRKRFIDFIVSLQNEPILEHQARIVSFIQEWKGAMTQTDDIVVIGIELP